MTQRDKVKSKTIETCVVFSDRRVVNTEKNKIIFE